MARDWNSVLAEHNAVMRRLSDAGATLDAVADAIVAALRSGRRVYTLGNGGSAADAQHIAGELLGRYKLERQALPAIAISTDTSTMTAVANDLGYERVFARQLEGLAQAGDVVWMLSTSGNSPSILAAAEVARRRGATLVGFTGAGGGTLAPMCDLAFRAPHDASDRIQEAHELGYHYVCERVEAALAEGGA
jgi:D-sedoheptulose 7-phosphate isomerase